MADKIASIKMLVLEFRTILMHKIFSKDLAAAMAKAIKSLIDHPEKPEVEIKGAEGAFEALRRMYLRGDVGRATAEETIAALRVITGLGASPGGHKNVKAAAGALKSGIISSKGTEKDVGAVCSGICTLYFGAKQKAEAAKVKKAVQEAEATEESKPKAKAKKKAKKKAAGKKK